MRHNRTLILGVPVDIVTEDEVLALVRDSIDARSLRHIITINAEYVMRARRDPAFRTLLWQSDLNTPDGTGVVWAARRRGCTIATRVGGADLIWSVACQAERRDDRLFLLGGEPGVAGEVAAQLQKFYPRLRIAGAHAGTSSANRDAEQVALVREAQPDILFVAFGSPAQDFWIARNKLELNVPVTMGVGGTFDYVAGRARRAPRWMQNAGLDWLWRLCQQPWRWRRMLVLIPFGWLALVRRG